MNENIKWGACAVAVVGLAIGAVVYRDKWWNDEPKPAAKPVAALPAEPMLPDAPPPEPAIQHPVPETPGPEPLPPLDASDKPIQAAVVDLMGADNVKQWVSPENLVRHIVVSIDNLPEQKVAERIRPLQRVPGEFTVGGTEDAPILDPANFQRYNSLVKTIQSLDTPRLVASYQRYYPLFQQSYEGLGHPPEYFNDRLIQVIDHLLETPDVKGPIPLARPLVQYEFADPKLEGLSAGQKLMIRMGGENAGVLKAKLRELRTALAAAEPAAKRGE
jgi:hypothetical protein